MRTNRWCLWISQHFMSSAGCRAAAGLAEKLRHGSEIPGVSPKLLAAQSCLLACRVVAPCGT